MLVCGSSLFYENPRYIMFIYMVINDALQLSLVTALYVVSYIFRKIHASICCCLVSWCHIDFRPSLMELRHKN